MQRTPISQRVPPGSGALADHDAAAGQLGHATVPGRRGRLTNLSPESTRKYNRWLVVYQEWCRDRGYQVELSFMDDDKAEEFLGFLVVDQMADDGELLRPRYAPTAVGQAITALRYWAYKAAVHPMPSFDGAAGVLHRYLDRLAEEGVITSRKQRAIRPGRPVG